MADMPRRWFPSLAFVGALLGIAGTVLVPPSTTMPLNADDAVVRLLGWPTLGLVVGGCIEILVSAARDPAWPHDAPGRHAGDVDAGGRSSEAAGPR